MLRAIRKGAGEEWLDMFWAAAEVAMPSMRAADLARVAREAAAAGVAPTECCMGRLLPRLHADVGNAPASCAVDALWALAKMRLQLGEAAASWLRPNTAVMSALLQCAAAGMADLSRTALADLVWSVATLGYRPPDAWLDAVALATYEAGLERFTSEDLARLAWGLASFNYMPPVEWLEVYAQKGAIYHPDYSAQGAAAVLWSLAVFQVLPERLWMNMFYTFTAGQLEEVPPDGLVNMLWSIASVEACKDGLGAEVDFSPVDGWLDEWFQAVAPHLAQMDGPCCVKLLWALALLGLEPSDAWLLPLLARASIHMQAGALRPEEVAYVATSSALLFGSAAPPEQGASADTHSAARTWPAWCQSFVGDAFAAVELHRLNLRAMNVRFPPYALPYALSPHLPVVESEDQRRERLAAARSAVGPLPPRQLYGAG